MKKLLYAAALTIFVSSAFAQEKEPKNEQGVAVSKASNETLLEGKEKGQYISDLAKGKSNGEFRKDDLNRDGKLSAEEKEARKAARRAEAQDRKADRADDGVVNNSTDKNGHGVAVSGIAKGTTLEGREKGAAVSDAARAKARNGEKTQRPEMKRQDGSRKVSRPAKPSGAGRPAGAGRPSNK